MKFTDGYWHMRADVAAYFAVQAHEVVVQPDALTAHASTRRLTSRGDTLNQVPLSVRFSAPAPNVIRVQIYHHKGRRPRSPQFALFPQPVTVETGDDAEA